MKEIHSMLLRISFGLMAIALLYSCAPINPSVMMKTPKDYEFDIPPAEQKTEYIIAPNDELSFRLYTNNGFKLVDITTSSEGGQSFMQANSQLSYLVEPDSMVNLPMVERVKIAGMTIKEAEFFLEEKYDEFWIDPFVMIEVVNRRVIIFPGDGGNGQVILLNDNNITLIEALALAGGISETGKAKKIKLVRGDLKDPTVYLIDLSTIYGLKDADIILQANDIIYVEPVGVTARAIISEIAPIMGFLTGLITLYFVLDRLDN